jgi:hypothetical protein
MWVREESLLQCIVFPASSKQFRQLIAFFSHHASPVSWIRYQTSHVMDGTSPGQVQQGTPNPHASGVVPEIRDNAGSRLKSKCRLLLMQIMVRYSG